MEEKRIVMIVDDDAEEAVLLAAFLTLNNYIVTITPTIYKDAIRAIELHFPDAILLSMSRADEDIIGLKIAIHVHNVYHIPLLLLIEHHEHEDLRKYVDALPYSCYIKSKDKNFNHEQILNALQFSEPNFVSKLCKYKAITLRVYQVNIDKKGEPISYEGMVHKFEDRAIQKCDLLYLKAGNAHFKNVVLIRLKSDKQHYYACRESLVQLLKLLNNKLFTQINGAYIISNEQITSWNRPFSVTVDDVEIPVSRKYREDVDRLYDYYHPKG